MLLIQRRQLEREGACRIGRARRIGCLKVGCEADFLVLDGDPLADFSATANIRQAWKDGQTLALTSPG